MSTYRHSVLQGQALQGLSRLDLVLNAPVANRRDRRPNQAAVGAGAGGAQQAVSTVRQSNFLPGHVCEPPVRCPDEIQTG